MSIDKMLAEMVADEVARALGPVQAALAELQGNSAIVSRLAAVLGQPVPVAKRGPGRPRKNVAAAVVVAAPKAGRKAKRGRKPQNAAGRGCAIMDCGRPERSTGYCAAHYQKFRMLARTGRLPADWVADATPNSVRNLALPRGRAGAEAVAEAKRK